MCLVSAKDENLRKMIKEIENLTEDFGKLQQIADITTSLRFVWGPQMLLFGIYFIFSQM